MSTTFTTFLWYLLGAALRALYSWLGWVQKPEGDRRTTMVQQLAIAGQKLILSVVVAFLWTGMHLWTLLEWMGVEVPAQIPVTPLSSIAAGFLLELFLVERLARRFALLPNGKSNGG